MSAPRQQPTDAAERAVLHLLEQVGAALGSEHRRGVAPIRDRLTGPVRVKLVGRVSAGKSTLVNAVVGRRVAATAAQDCTLIPTVYRHGSPDRTLAIGEDGASADYGFGFDARDQAAETTGIARLEVHLGSGLLRQVTLIDTPGLAATTGLTHSPSRTGLDADVLLYLFRGAMRSDDAAVVTDFRAANEDRLDAVACVGLLSHADTFGAGPWDPADPIATARASATTLHATLAGQFSAVLPVAGLLAEAGRVGVVTERDAAALRSLDRLDHDSRQFFDQLPVPAGVDAEAVRRVRTLVGGYGLRYGPARAGSAAELLSWLVTASGITQVEHHIQHDLLPVVRRGRADRALADLVRVLSRSDVDRRLRAYVEQVTQTAVFQPLREYRAYRVLVRQVPNSTLVAELATLINHPEQLPTEPSELRARAAVFQGRYAVASRAAEAQAARTLSDSLLLRSGTR